MKNEDIKKGIASALLFAVLLTGCDSENTDSVKNNNDSDYIKLAIILGDNTATIVDPGYYHVSSGYTIMEYPDGSSISASNVVIVNGFKDYSDVERLARSLVGEDGEINYYSHDTKVLSRKIK